MSLRRRSLFLKLKKGVNILEKRRTGRILGKCPKCGILSCIAIDVPSRKNAKCVKCGFEWSDWMEDVILEENRKGINLMTPVILEAGRSSIMLLTPARRHIDFRNLIDRTTETAVKVIFSVEMTDEDEVELSRDIFLKKTGIIMGFKGPLIRSDIFKGHEASYDLNPMIKAGKRYKDIFEWIEGFWRLIFMDEFRFGSLDFGRGMILGLSSDKPMHLSLSKLILYYALQNTTGSKEITENILDSMEDKFDARKIITENGIELPESRISEVISAIL